METETFNIDELLIRVLSHQAEQEEIVYFSEWMKDERNRLYFEKFRKVWNLSSGRHADREMVEAGLEDYRRFMHRSLSPKHSMKRVWRMISAVAVVMIGVFALLHLYEPEKPIVPEGKEIIYSKGILLTLSDGRKVNVLSDSLALSDGMKDDIKISKINNREIAYELNDSLAEAGDFELAYNEIIVPAGERFSLRLSDGTKVWINSESSLRYPIRFGKERREVEVRGNVYFEVTRDTACPFVVAGRELVTEVLGTSFEVNLYGDRDEASATLVEGKVRVQAGKHAVVMKPDEQIVFNMKSGDVEVKKVDAANMVRWKDGVLVIDNERFDDVVWKLERWYGVTIINETGKSFSQLFSGEFDREDVRAAIETICVNLGIQYRMNEDSIILQK
ncbi:FecR family protein [uncultured Butyricimonas sp.]|uniref:FecR family protein n=1 Tax=uncultured Butyricimonas sp. TaxID=1268785 RepID=UPI0026DA73D0|nr:FecR domain-containing protein [uncultured Butyricimonas sp.]